VGGACGVVVVVVVAAGGGDDDGHEVEVPKIGRLTGGRAPPGGTWKVNVNPPSTVTVTVHWAWSADATGRAASANPASMATAIAAAILSFLLNTVAFLLPPSSTRIAHTSRPLADASCTVPIARELCNPHRARGREISPTALNFKPP